MLSNTLRQFKSFTRLRLIFVQEREAAAAKAVAAKVNTFTSPLTMTIIVVMMTSIIVTMDDNYHCDHDNPRQLFL